MPILLAGFPDLADFSTAAVYAYYLHLRTAISKRGAQKFLLCS